MSGYQSPADRRAPITTRPLRKPQDTPLTGSTTVWCACGARGVANKGLLKRGQHKITSCINCRGQDSGTETSRKQPSGTPTSKRRPIRPADKGPAVPPTLTCSDPITRGPRRGKPATGTTTGYIRHYRKGEPACTACKQATAAANKAWRTR